VDFCDLDGDGVAENEDVCPNTPPGVPVDATGCPIEAPPEQPEPPDAGAGGGDSEAGSGSETIGDDISADDEAPGPGDGDANGGSASSSEPVEEAAPGQASPLEEGTGTGGGGGRRSQRSTCGALGMTSLVLLATGLALVGRAGFSTAFRWRRRDGGHGWCRAQ
jgi:hypothetical protein